MFENLRSQPRVQDTNLTKLVLINLVSVYLLSTNKINLNAIIRPLGSLINTYHIELVSNDIKPLRTKIYRNDITRALCRCILNEGGMNDNLKYLLKLLVSYDNIS